MSNKLPIYTRGLLLLFVAFKMGISERRILRGTKATSDKRYMVYLVKAPQSLQAYDTWLCGGAIVTPEFIVTSAACIEDVTYMYAIAGYNKYVEDIESDECIQNTKKKIIFTCVPKEYVLDYDKVEKWSSIDIGVAQVESPFDFADSSGLYEKYCSWIPNKIYINYDPKYEETNKDAYVIGWGSKLKMREDGDSRNFNEPELLYAPTKIYSKEKCIEAYKGTPVAITIEKYMICTLEKGNINEDGFIIEKAARIDCCGKTTKKPVEFVVDTVSTGDSSVNKLNVVDLDDDRETIHFDKLNSSQIKNGIWFNKTRKNSDRNPSDADHNTDTKSLRRQGICQNDHGGPLVSWVGAHEVLIGVASMFRVYNDSVCTGPFLFASTYCNGLFLECLLTKNDNTRRRECDQTPEEKGFHMIEKSISWAKHPAGPAENELRVRTEIPFSDYLDYFH